MCLGTCRCRDNVPKFTPHERDTLMAARRHRHFRINQTPPIATMPTDKAAYLAAHYLSASTRPPSSSKKRKRKPATAAAPGLLITDDDETGWGSPSTRKDDADDDDTPMTIAGTSTDFRRAKKSAWKPLRSGGSHPAANPNASAGAAEADAIIASAAAETAAAAAAEAADDLLLPAPPQTPALMPVYKGPAAPNRYGIRPGYRWDGVDRGTGFEGERFKAINRRERNKGLDYAWQMDE
ncbi:hypothetical protein BT67DRAFT_456310 [Trichocladium antarcticum]|uniref:Pre-mRNA-splicing factor CWC26 n=1 Tax=Trichocladium antarcticum TaxID=1450529 RepID=A0AAN6UJY8_9PEZI|nr:hypothetical protein BT67DRAFT_456310 [Trichocladium antarcticum]